MPEPLSIRPAVEADLDRIVDLIAELDTYHQPFEPDLVHQGTPVPAKRDGFARFLNDEGFVVLVAAEGGATTGEAVGTIAGFVRMQIEDRKENRIFKARRVGIVHELAVAADSRRSGLGRALMAAVHDAARSRDVDYVTLSHFASNEATGRFYDAIGYRPHMRHMIMKVK